MICYRAENHKLSPGLMTENQPATLLRRCLIAFINSFIPNVGAEKHFCIILRQTMIQADHSTRCVQGQTKEEEPVGDDMFQVATVRVLNLSVAL